VLSHAGNTLCETGSSVVALKALRRWKLPIPLILGGPSCWELEYTIEFKLAGEAVSIEPKRVAAPDKEAAHGS
jgi:hypothetical protein